MKNISVVKPVFLLLFPAICLFLIHACELPASGFGDDEDAVFISKSNPAVLPAVDSSIRVMTWNIRFGIGRGAWFGDACGYKVIYPAGDITANMAKIADRINSVKPDILLLQEVDINSARSGYVDELQYLLDHTYFDYAVYGLQWKAQFIPSDGLGRLYEANVILSRWPFGKSIRIQLPLRGDQDALTRFFYERCCMVDAEVLIPGVENFHAVNIHASAFATDDTKHQHILDFEKRLDEITGNGGWFVAGGDMNTLPPGSDSTDFCDEDRCEGESFHQPGDNPQHKEGSNYEPEKDWLTGLYGKYKSAVPLADYQKNQPAYFTHTTRPAHTWDRTLDYLFTNSRWQAATTVTHQDFLTDSDHAPVSSKVMLIKNSR